MAHHIINPAIIKPAYRVVKRFVPENFFWSLVEAQRGCFFLWSPVFFALGVGLYFSLPFEPDLWVGAGAVLSLSALYFLFSKSFLNLDNYRFLFLLFMGGWIACAGFFMAQVRTIGVHTEIIPKKMRFADIGGQVERLETIVAGKAVRVVLSDIVIEGLEPDKTPRRVRLKISKGSDALEVGQRISILASLNPPSAPVVPGGFDFARHMYFQGIGAVGFSYREPEVLQHNSSEASMLWVEKLRHTIAARLYRAMPENTGAIAAALIVGDKQSMQAQDRDAMRTAGVAHLLAISGLHIGLVCGILFFSARFLMACFPHLALNYPIKKYAAMAALFGGVTYMMIAGATVPTQRAILMSGVVLFAVMFDRMAISMRLVAFAALVVLVLAPESLLSASFQLSFAAVSGLIAFYEVLRPYMKRFYEEAGILRRVLFYFAGVSMTSVIATLATMPFALFHFQQLATYGLLGNLVAVPLMGFIIMPAGILAVLLMPVGAEGLPLMLMGLGIEAVLDLAHWIEARPHSLFYVPAWSFKAWLCFVCAGLFLTLGRGLLRLAAVVSLLLSFVFINGFERADILVSQNLKLVMGKFGESYMASSLRAERFTRENWQRYFGAQGQEILAFDRIAAGIRCDEGACRTVMKGRNISFVRQAYALRSECGWADLIISQEPVQDRICGSPNVIDKWDAWRHGTHAVYLRPGHMRIDTAQALRGDRPWVVKR